MRTVISVQISKFTSESGSSCLPSTDQCNISLAPLGQPSISKKDPEMTNGHSQQSSSIPLQAPHLLAVSARSCMSSNSNNDYQPANIAMKAALRHCVLRGTMCTPCRGVPSALVHLLGFLLAMLILTSIAAIIYQLAQAALDS